MKCILLNIGSQNSNPTYTTEYQANVRILLDNKKREFEERYESSTSSITKKLDDFDLIRTIGTGNFGRVILAYLKSDQSQPYAIKMLKKENIVKKENVKQIEHSLSEKKILSSIDFPFIIRLAYSFKDNSNLYMVLEYASGGEMFTHLRKSGRFNEEIACFYASQIVLTFEYLHHLNIIYRDLKPENVLYGEDGYLKITDFGFAKVCNLRTGTFCGTPEYLAPEVVLKKSYNKAVDWWALGVLIYEMAAGYPPFSDSNPVKIAEKIVSGYLRFPAHFSVKLKNLLKDLLQVDLTKRIGNLKNGVSDIKQHRWFNKIDWTAVYEKTIKAPYIPTQEYDYYDEERLTISTTEKYAIEFKDF
jgi:protein kinase A